MPNTGKKVLLVDDKESIRSTIGPILTEIGYHVRSAVDGFSALREIRQEMPDILLSDLNMPRMSGFELLTVVRRRFPAILVVAMSGSFTGNEVPSGVLADAFYQKGSSTNALLHIFEDLPLLERRAAFSSHTAASLWTQRSEKSLSAKNQVMIACPECLRNFPHVLEALDCSEHEVECIHCRNSIQFEMANPVDCIPMQAFLQRDGNSSSVRQVSALGN